MLPRVAGERFVSTSERAPCARHDEPSTMRWTESRAMDGRIGGRARMWQTYRISRDRTALSSGGRRQRSFGIARYMQPVFPNRMSRRRGTCDAGPTPAFLSSTFTLSGSPHAYPPPRAYVCSSTLLSLSPSAACRLPVVVRRVRNVCETLGVP